MKVKLPRISLTFQLFPKRRIFRLILSERVCRRQFQFDEYGTKFSEWLESSVGKGEIPRYEQFLLFPQCFQKICTADT